MPRGRIFSGMRPTARLHLGNYKGALENWISLQNDYECFFSIVDWHALTTCYQNTSQLTENVRQMLVDWVAAGLNPERNVLFVQSHVKEHAELHLLLSMITPLGWLERVPTYKEQLRQLEDREIATYGFLGYPVLQTADILGYEADTVPVGEDQLPHLELCREIVRRFNHLYGTSLVEPQARLSQAPMLPGLDGRKMSKSYGNDIALSASAEEVVRAVGNMVTDPQRIHKSDPGHPEVCIVYAFHKVFSPDVSEIESSCRAGRIGCVACKKGLSARLNNVLEPMRERRSELESNPSRIDEILADGADRARETISKTMEKIRAAIRI